MNKLEFTTEGIRKNEEMLRKISEEDTINIANAMNEITRGIREKEDNAAAMEFTKVICGILKENGVSVVARKYIYDRRFNKTFDMLSENYGVSIEGLDFSQHDKEFADKIEDMQSEINRLQNEYAEALRRLEERQARIKELESKQYDGILFISVDGKPKAYTEEELCKMAKTYEDIKYCEEHSGEHLHSEEHLKILSLNRTVFELQSEVEKYRKDFEEAKKERDCQIAEYQNRVDKDKAELERAKNTINQIDDILEKLFGVRHDTVDKSDEFEKILKQKAENYNTIADYLCDEPISVAQTLISAKRSYELTEEEKKRSGFERGYYHIFNVSELKQIAEHLLIYCNANEGK